MKDTQIPCQKRVSPCGKIHIFIENETELSVFHDFMLSEKGKCIDLMVQIQKQEEDLRNQQMKQEEDHEE